MNDFTTINEEIRFKIISRYEVLKQDFFKNHENYDEIDEELETEELFCLRDADIENDELFGIEDEGIETDDPISLDGEDFEKEVYDKIIDEIDKSKFKNIARLIMLQDVWEYLKSNQIINLKFLPYEEKMLEFLENWEIKDLFSKINTSKDFYRDLLVIFAEYLSISEIEDRIKNKKLIELSNNYKGYDKFKIGKIDDIQYQYTKTRKF